MTRRTSPAVALGTLVGLVLGAVAFVTVSAGSPDPVPVSRVSSSDTVAEPVVLGVSDGDAGTEDAAHLVRAPKASDDADDADEAGDDATGDDVVVPATRDDDADDTDDAGATSARPTADDDHHDDGDDHGDDDEDDDDHEDEDEDEDDEDDDDGDDD